MAADAQIKILLEFEGLTIDEMTKIVQGVQGYDERTLSFMKCAGYDWGNLSINQLKYILAVHRL